MFSPKIVDGDLMIDENGDIVMVEGDEELAQSVRMILETRKGEFFLEPDHGLVFDNLLGKEADLAKAHEDIVEAVLQEERIASVEDVIFTDNQQERTRSVSLKMQKTDGGTLSLEGVNVQYA